MTGSETTEEAQRVFDWHPTGAEFVAYVKAIMTSSTMDEEETGVAALLGVPRSDVQYSGDQLYVSGHHFGVVTPDMTVDEAREAAAVAGPHWHGSDMWVSAASVTDAFRAYVRVVEAAGLAPQYSPRAAARGEGTALAEAGERVLVATMWHAAAGGGDLTDAARTLARWAAECVHRIQQRASDALLHRPGGSVLVVEYITGSMARAVWDAWDEPNATRGAAGLLSTIASIEAEYGVTGSVSHYAAMT